MIPGTCSEALVMRRYVINLINHPTEGVIVRGEPACNAMAALMNHHLPMGEQFDDAYMTSSIVQGIANQLYDVRAGRVPYSLADLATAMAWATGGTETRSVAEGLPLGYDALREHGREVWSGATLSVYSTPRVPPCMKAIIADGRPIALALQDQDGRIGVGSDRPTYFRTTHDEWCILDATVVLLVGWDDDRQHFICVPMDGTNAGIEGIVEIPYEWSYNNGMSLEAIYISTL